MGDVEAVDEDGFEEANDVDDDGGGDGNEDCEAVAQTWALPKDGPLARGDRGKSGDAAANATVDDMIDTV